MEEGSQKAASERLGIRYQMVKNHMQELYRRLSDQEGRYVCSAAESAYILWLRDLWSGGGGEARPTVVHLSIDGVRYDATPATTTVNDAVVEAPREAVHWARPLRSRSGR